MTLYDIPSTTSVALVSSHYYLSKLMICTVYSYPVTLSGAKNHVPLERVVVNPFPQ
jgi:hypothetical protein